MGFAGANLYVILDGRGGSRPRRRGAGAPRPRRVLRRRVGAPRGAADGRRRRGDSRSAASSSRRGELERFLLAYPPVAVRMLEGDATASRDDARVAGIEAAERPSRRASTRWSSSAAAPAGCRRATASRGSAIDHAVLSRDDSPGGMFRVCPIFQRLLSWSKPDAPVRAHDARVRVVRPQQPRRRRAGAPGSRARGHGPDVLRSHAAGDGSRPRNVRGARGHPSPLRLHAGSRRGARRTASLTLTTSDGEYRCRVAVFALGVTEPWKSDIPGIEDVPHYIATGDPRAYRGSRVVVIGKRNSGFEIADGLLPWARQIVLVSPRPVQTSVLALSSVRVRYMQPLEDDALGGGTLALDAAVERVERTGDGLRVHATGTTRPCTLALEADDVIAATGFRTPLARPPKSSGAQTVAQGRIPALTTFWESVGAPGVYFAGNATQGSPGLRRHGVGASSPGRARLPLQRARARRAPRRRATSACAPSGRAWRRRASCRSSRTSWPTRRSSGRRRATSPGSSPLEGGRARRRHPAAGALRGHGRTGRGRGDRRDEPLG